MESALALALWLGFLPGEPDVQLSDLERLPCHVDQLDWADRHVAWIQANQDLDLVYPAFWEAWRTDACDARQPWKELMLARDINCTDEWRLRRLRDLRDLIGYERYKAIVAGRGTMPSSVPVKSLWRFQRIP